MKEFQLFVLPSSTAGWSFWRGTATLAFVVPPTPAVREQLPPLPSETV